MSLLEKFDRIFAEKQIPMSRETVEDGVTLYRAQFTVRQGHVVGIEMLVEKDEPYCDVQITYRWVHQVLNYDQRLEVLDCLNRLNGMKSGYYTLFLADDGEIYMRCLMRCGADVYPVYETLFRANGVLQFCLPEIEKLLGSYNNG